MQDSTAVKAIRAALNAIVHRAGVFLALAVMMVLAPALHAQATTATVTGTVTDSKGALVRGASVQVTSDATGSVRPTTTNNDGVYTVPNLEPSTYTVKVTAPGFAPKELTGIDLHAGDQIKLPTFALAIGAVTDTVTVSSVAGQILTTENGQRTATLTYQDIQDVALTGRDTTEMLKVLPGVVQVTSGGSVNYNPLSETTGQSAIGNGMGVNGAPYKGGVALNMDGAGILDVGDDFSGLATVNPEMTQEVQLQSSNFGADTANGPVVINTTGKSGGDHFHGEGYFNARNDVFNANDWQDNHTGHPKAGASYYYPGGNISGPIPFTHKKMFFFGGFELPFQNQGNANHLAMSIPTPEMLGGDFSTDNADNLIMCPDGFLPNGGQQVAYGGGTFSEGNWCNNIAATNGNTQYTILPDGTIPLAPTSVPVTTTAGYASGGIILPGYINQNMIDFSKVWPAWNSPYTAKTTQQINANGGYNFYEPIINHDNGWVARGRIDFNWNPTNQFYISYQQSYDRQLASGCGESFYGGCGANTIQYPGGGIYKTTYSKIVNGHYTHIFSATLTNEALASWVWGNIPLAPNNPSANYRSTLGATFGCIYCTNQKYMPTFNGGNGTNAFPNAGQADDWEPGNYYIVQKAVPTFADNLTKVWGKHTLKFGAMTSNTDNYQGNQSQNLQGVLGVGGSPNNYHNYFATQGTCAVCAGYTGLVGSYNTDANFVTGSLTNYTESSSAPLSDVAYQTIAFYANDQIKATSRLSIELGLRFEHIGWWYDRDGTGLAVFYPSRVLPDFYAGKYAPGYYWHAIDSGVPLSGRPNRLGFISPRFGISYDLFGNGKTTVRGGYGAYRYQEAANDPQNALNTAQGAQSFGASSLLPTNTSFLTSQIGQLNTLLPYCFTECKQNGQTGYSSNDYGLPLNYAYNFTIDQQLPWHMLLDLAYVGNHAMHMSDNGQDQGNLSNYDNQNITPLGAYFAPDPVTNVTACNPEKLNAACSPNNNAYDYQPFGRLHTTGCSGGTNPNCLIYGTNGVTMTQNNVYQNYNAMQAQLVKRAGPVTLNLNFTWSKSLGTVGNFDSFHIHSNNTYDNLNRPFVFNSSYIYREPNFYHGNRIVSGALNGWTLSGVTLWQKGTNTLPGISIQYDPASIPAPGNPQSLTTSTLGVGSSTFFGTNGGITTGRPQLTCDPKSGLVSKQLYRPCFTAAPFGSPGGLGLPFIAGPAFIENDLSIFKTFTVHEQNKIRFQLEAFNWLNHPLPTFAGSGESNTEYYFYNYTTHAISPNETCTGTAVGSCNPNGPYLATTTYAKPNQDPATLFGQMHYKNGYGGNSQRILEFEVKYTF